MINYKNISDAINFYKDRGYEEIDTPWLVDRDVDQITNPSYGYTIQELNKVLVGSGEQGFLQLIKDNKIQPGKYQTTTACFRGDEEDELHQRYFLKNELIEIIEPFEKFTTINNFFFKKSGGINFTLKLDESLWVVINDVCDFFKTKINFPLNVIKIDNSELYHDTLCQYDIISNNIELGSYGIRYSQKLDIFWIYGTGCAEPRLSKVMNYGKF